jgi:hypothetical protein
VLTTGTFYTKTQVDTKFSQMTDSAPDALNTLAELARALGNDANYATNISNQVLAKADKATTYTTTQVDGFLAAKQPSLNWLTGDSTRKNIVSTGQGRLTISTPNRDGTLTDAINIKGPFDGASSGQVNIYTKCSMALDLAFSGTIYGAGGAAVQTTLTGYTQTQVDNSLTGKADTLTTYTKTEVNTALAGKADTGALANKADTQHIPRRKLTQHSLGNQTR